MKKILLVSLISFCALLKVRAQTKTISKDSIPRKAVFTKTKIDTQPVNMSSKQNLIIDTSEKNKHKSRIYEVITQFVVRKIKDSSFVIVEVNNKFPDKADRWKQYLIKNLNANTPNNNKAKPGTYQVIVRFIESKDGYPSEVIALTNHGYGMEAEVESLIRKSQRWVPATQNGSTIRPYRK